MILKSIGHLEQSFSGSNTWGEPWWFIFPDVLERSAARQVAFLQHEWAFYSQTAICLKLEYNGF